MTIIGESQFWKLADAAARPRKTGKTGKISETKRSTKSKSGKPDSLRKSAARKPRHAARRA